MKYFLHTLFKAVELNDYSGILPQFNCFVRADKHSGTFFEIFCDHIYAVKLENPNAIVIDYGANRGYFIQYIQKRYPNAIFFGYEMNPIYMKYHSKFNKEKVIIRYIGVSNKYGEKCVDLIENPAQSLRQTGQHLVETIPAHQTIFNYVDLVKIDIEGEEYSVLEDLAKHNKMQLIKHIFIEHHSNTCNKSLGELLLLLEKTHIIQDIKTVNTDNCVFSIIYAKVKQ